MLLNLHQSATREAVFQDVLYFYYNCRLKNIKLLVICVLWTGVLLPAAGVQGQVKLWSQSHSICVQGHVIDFSKKTSRVTVGA